MNDRIDFQVVRTLLRKQRQERRYGFRKGNFDLVGLLLRIALVAVFITFFVLFFGQFARIYVAIPTNNRVDEMQRLYEMLTIAYTVVLVLMVVSGMSAIVSELFLADDVKIFSGMPVSASSLFIAKLIGIYRGQFVFAAAAILTVNISLFLVLPQGVWFIIMTLLACAIFPIISIAIASILALPFYALRQFLQPRFVLMFITVTLVAAFAIVLYSIILGAVKGLMLGGRDISEFFNGEVMDTIRVVVSFCYPCNWLASFLLGHEFIVSSIGIIILLAICIFTALFIIRGVLIRAMQSRISGDENFMHSEQPITEEGSVFAALLKKEFVQIFRTPSYMFSYFSVAILMPLMVYFLMDVGASMLTEQFGLDCSLELAIFLTLLFSALTNIFCSTNISREGTMFYSLKALPVSPTQFFLSKIFFCMIVTVISQIFSALMLGFTSQLAWGPALFVCLIGIIFSFGQICFATRYDFNHARFSTEDDGEIKESSGTVSTIIVLGMVVAFAVGIGLLILRMYLSTHSDITFDFGWLSYVLSLGVSLAIAIFSFIYLTEKLNRRYYEFSGGGLF